MAYYEKSGTGRFMEMAIPIILIILVLLVVGCKFGGFCPPPLDRWLGTQTSNRILIITNPTDHEDAKGLLAQINTVTRTTGTTIAPNVGSVGPSSLTSNNWRLVVLYGDNTALTNVARTEITNYVENGGSLLIIGGAGLQELQSDKLTISPWIFGWAVGDMSRIIRFIPDCPPDNCQSISQITVSRDEMNPPVYLVPAQYDHPIIDRLGMDWAREIPLANYPDFGGVTLVKDQELVYVATIDWMDSGGRVHQTDAIIAYDTGTAGMTGGRVMYMAFNPMDIDHEELFRTVIEYGLHKVN